MTTTPFFLLDKSLLVQDFVGACGMVDGRRHYHSSTPFHSPDKKATVEKAMDTIKEKKKKAVKVAAKVRFEKNNVLTCSFGC